MFLAPKWYNLEMEYGTIMENRAQFLVIKGLPRGDTCFINLYTPNDTVAGTLF